MQAHCAEGDPGQRDGKERTRRETRGGDGNGDGEENREGGGGEREPGNPRGKLANG